MVWLEALVVACEERGPRSGPNRAPPKSENIGPGGGMPVGSGPGSGRVTATSKKNRRAIINRPKATPNKMPPNKIAA